jgi:integrase
MKGGKGARTEGTMRRKLTGFIKYATPNEIAAIIAWFYLRPEKFMRRYYYILRIQSLGLRIGEVVRLKKENLNADCSRLTYLKEKTRQVQVRVIPKAMRQDLFQLRDSLPIGKEYLFWTWGHGAQGDYIAANSVQAFFYKARKQLGLDEIYHTVKYADGRTQHLYRITPHTMRHESSELWTNKCGFRVAAGVLGHDPETNVRYYQAPHREAEAKYADEVYAPIQRALERATGQAITIGAPAQTFRQYLSIRNHL